jgi:hypothetical protein
VSVLILTKIDVAVFVQIFILPTPEFTWAAEPGGACHV